LQGVQGLNSNCFALETITSEIRITPDLMKANRNALCFGQQLFRTAGLARTPEKSGIHPSQTACLLGAIDQVKVDE